MKIHSLFTEILIFLVVLLFFILPPIFNVGSGDETVVIQWTFPWLQLTLALFAILLLILYHKSEKSKTNIFGFRILFTIGLLFTSYLFITFLSLVVPVTPSVTISQVTFTTPNTFSTWLFCILNFIFAAFYEEVLYRFYLSDSLRGILVKISPSLDNKIIFVICEIIGCGLFAFGHLYLGIFAVVHAALSHFALRYVYRKSNSIIPGFIAHFVYNMISIILL